MTIPIRLVLTLLAAVIVTLAGAMVAFWASDMPVDSLQATAKQPTLCPL